MMERIASFTVNHDVLTPGLYLSRRDGDVVTFDLRFKKPNTGDLLSNSEMHSVEHVIATLLRNSASKDAVVYFGPMGCQTGFYFLFDGGKLTTRRLSPCCRRFSRQALPSTARCPATAQGSAATAAIWMSPWPAAAAGTTRRLSPAGMRPNWPIPRRNDPILRIFSEKQRGRLSSPTRKVSYKSTRGGFCKLASSRSNSS